MKSILLAAAAFIAGPAIAQTTTPTDSTTTQTAPMDQTAPPADTTTAPAGDPSMSTPPSSTPTDPSMTTQSQTMPAPTTGSDGSTATPAGGYQPNQPAMSGQMAPGATVRYQPGQDPATAFPPPAPKESYPVCKKGQYDGCTQAGEGRSARKATRRRR